MYAKLRAIGYMRFLEAKKYFHSGLDEYPTISTLAEFNFAVTSLTFPAVTICADVAYYKFGMTRALLNM